MKTLLCLCIAVLCGCASAERVVPANRITIAAPSGHYEIATPKNVEITDFDAIVETNGQFHVKFKRWASTNDPQVVDKAYAGAVALTDSHARFVKELGATIGAAEGAAAKAATH